MIGAIPEFAALPAATAQEFWADVGHAARLNWETKKVSVPPTDPPASPAAGHIP